MTIEAAPTVREAVVSAMDTVLPEAPAVAPAPEAVAAPAPTAKPAPADAPLTETDAQKAERLRDEKGRFVEGKAPPKAEAKPIAPVVAAVPAVPLKPKVPRPSSWKKELEQHWESLAPEVQAYVGQREREYATGVSTYKGEADRAKEVMSAIAPFEPTLQQHGIPIQRWINDLGTAHHTLALGSPQDKVMQAVKIIQSYGVDAQALFQVLSGQQPQYQQQAPRLQQQPQTSPQDIEKLVEKRVMEKEAANSFKAFSEAKDESGESKYPYFEDVKGTMAGLLQAGLAQDYVSAYEASLRLPQHANIWEVLQQQQNAKTEAEKVQAATQTAQRARSQAVSVKSSTPTVMAAADGKKGLREQLSEEFDRAAASRV